MVVGIVQVVGRYFFPALAISWAEEVIVYLVVWGVMIVSSQLVRTDGHVRPDLVLRLVPPNGQRWLEAFNCVVALVFCSGMIWYGCRSSIPRVAGRAQLQRTAVPDVDLLLCVAGGWGADDGALSDPAVSLRVPV